MINILDKADPNQKRFDQNTLMPLTLMSSSNQHRVPDDSMKQVSESMFKNPPTEWLGGWLDRSAERLSSLNKTYQAPEKHHKHKERHQHSQRDHQQKHQSQKDQEQKNQQPQKDQEQKNQQPQKDQEQKQQSQKEQQPEAKQEENQHEDSWQDHQEEGAEDEVPIDAKDHNKIIKLLENSINELNEIKKVVVQMIKTNGHTKTLGLSLLVGGSIVGGTLLALSSGLLMPMLASSAAVTGFLSKLGIQSMLLDKQKHLLNNSKIILNKALKRFQNHPRIKSLIQQSHEKLDTFQKSVEKHDHTLLVKTLEDILDDLNDSLKAYKAADQ